MGIRVGKGRWPIKLPWRCFERIDKELSGKGWARITGLRNDVKEGSLDWIVQQYTGGLLAGSYVAPILEHCGLAEIDRGRPHRIRLITG
ncbi:MAG: hypothetical protein E3J35_09350 [Methanomassiliicoccales archaeon]|nr:MAG: hypothetical protein E3J35_09350 [Methanomassiliicoccales archaeon]